MKSRARTANVTARALLRVVKLHAYTAVTTAQNTCTMMVAILKLDTNCILRLIVENRT